MATDNRTEINDCEQDAGWTGTDNPDLTGVSSGDTVYYQGSECLGAQFSNSLEYIMVTEDSGGTGLNLSLGDSIVWLLIKDNLIETESLGGFQIVLSDGTDTIGYYVGGNDKTGLVLGKTYYCLRLDVSNRDNLSFGPNAFAGSAVNLDANTVTGVGYGSLHATVARGNVNNLFVDRITTIANGSYALTIDGGTSSVPIDLSTLVEQDANTAIGWGVFGTGAGESYTIFATLEFGDSGTSNSYFSQSDSQIFFDGTDMGSGNWIFRVFGNATGTNSFVLNNCVMASPGEGAIWDMTDTNIDVLDIQDTQFVDMGTVSFPVSGGTTRQILGSTFINSGQIDFSSITATNITFIGTKSSTTGTILIDSVANTAQQTNFDFTIGTSGGHGVYITEPGEYDFNNWTFNGYSTSSPGDNFIPNSGSANSMVYNDSGGLVTINIIDGTTVTVRNGASANTIVNATVTITVTGLKDNSEVRIYDSEDNSSPYSTPTELAGIEIATVGSVDDREFSFTATPGNTIYIRVFNTNWITDDITYIVPSTSQNVPVSQRLDRVYVNP